MKFTTGTTEWMGSAKVRGSDVIIVVPMASRKDAELALALMEGRTPNAKGAKK